MPFSRDVVAELRQVPWARWDTAKAWRIPFRSFEELRRRWLVIEEGAHRAEPEERRKRAQSRKASPRHAERLAAEAERRRRRYPVPNDALPPLGQVLMRQAGCVVLETVTVEVVELSVATRFYPDVVATAGTMIRVLRRRPTHDELVRAWPARAAPSPAEIARGWWQSTIETLREERRKAASLERARETRWSKSP